MHCNFLNNHDVSHPAIIYDSIFFPLAHGQQLIYKFQMISIFPLKNHRCIRNYYTNQHKTQLKYMCDLDKTCNYIWDRV